MDFGFTVNSNVNDITAGIGTNICKLITKSIESNSIESFYQIDGFCHNILMMSIENKYIYHFKEYLDIIIGYYIISYDYITKNEALYGRICQACADRAARRIQESFFLLNHFFNKSDLQNKKLYNQFKLLAFTSFSQLLFEQTKRKDITWFKFTLNQIENVFIGGTIQTSEFATILNNSTNYPKSQLDDYIEDIQASLYAKHVFLGIRYWIYYLYENKQLSLKEAISFIEPTKQFKGMPLSIDYWEIELLFNRLNSNKSLGYFNWINWDYKIHREGEFYTMPDMFEWFFSGYIIDSINCGYINIASKFDINLINGGTNSQYSSILISKLKEYLNNIISNKDTWIHYFKNSNFDNNINSIQKQLNSFSSSLEIQKVRQIASQKLDKDKENEFKESLCKSWNLNKIIRNVFEYFEKKIKCNESNSELKYVGRKIFFEKGKTLFLNDESFLHKYEGENLGIQLSKMENDFFFQIILKEQTEIVYPSIIAGLQQAFKKIKNQDYNPSIIFIDSNLSYMGIKNDKKWSDNKSSNFINGYYDYIPVCFINTILMQDRFIVADFKKAFSMQYNEVHEGFNKELKVDIQEVTDTIAQDKLRKEQEKWKNIDEREISDDEALAYIKTSVIVNFGVIELFEVNDYNAFEIGLIENNSSV